MFTLLKRALSETFVPFSRTGQSLFREKPSKLTSRRETRSDACFASGGLTERKASKAVGALSRFGKALNDLSENASVTAHRRRRVSLAGGGVSNLLQYWPVQYWPARIFAGAIFPAVLAFAGCGGGVASTSTSSNGTFSLSPSTTAIDTNCTGCNATNASGTPVEQFSAMLSGGGAASVTWTVSGGDANAGAGSITSSGQYSPPPYLTANSAQVTVTATLSTSTTTKATATITVTPGFLQPLTPENVALGSAGTVTVTGYIAEAGGSTGINYAVSSSATGSSGGQGSLGTPCCTRSTSAFTFCSVTYSAPTVVASTAATYVVATVGTSPSREAAEVLLNTVGIDSNPATHQAQLTTPISLGSSGGNNHDYDTQGNQIEDCCGGTLGALVQNTRRNAIHPQLQSRAGAQRSGCHRRNDCSARFDRQQLHAQWRWIGNHSRRRSHGLASAEFQHDKYRRRHRASRFRRRQHERRDSRSWARVQNGELAAAPPGISSTGGKGEAASLNLLWPRAAAPPASPAPASRPSISTSKSRTTRTALRPNPT